jgi:hypothetical protein
VENCERRKNGIEGATEGATESAKRKLVILLRAIITNEGKRVPDYVKITNLPAKSVEKSPTTI